MSQQNDRIKCVVCNAYLFEDDDTVYCPECGAPHHRDCYSSIGHCHLEAYHSTEQSYDKLQKKQSEAQQNQTQTENDRLNISQDEPDADEVKCGMCCHCYDKELRGCPKCGTVNFTLHGGAPYDLLGGVPGELDIGDGVTADEAKRFVISNTQRYIPKFAAMNLGTKASWNWFAFFFPAVWLLSRKMYKNGIIVSVLSIVFTLFTLPFQRVLQYIDLPADIVENASVFEYYRAVAESISENMPQIGIAVIISAFIGAVLSLVIKFFIAIKGDYMYKKHTIESIKTLRKESLDIDDDYRRLGGISVIAMLIGFFATQYLPSIIMMFI